MLYLAIGSYTHHKTIDARGPGVSIVHWDNTANSLDVVSEDASVQNPTYLDWDAQSRRLYSVSATSEGMGAVAAFSVETNGRLDFLHQKKGSGRPGCHILTIPEIKSLFAVAYSGGQLTGFALEAGNIGAENYHVDYQGRGPNPERQEAPHAHQVTRNPYAPYLYVCDLGTDTIWMHKLDTENAPAGKPIGEPSTALTVPPGYGPRHLAYDPLLPVAYILCELVPKILVTLIDPASGTMSIIAELDTAAADKMNIAAPAAVKLHPSGQTLAVSNRFDDTIAVFSINRESGAGASVEVPTLSLIERFSCGGKTPRDIEFSPDGSLLFMANQDSHTVTSRYFDPENGRPSTKSGPALETGSPVCIVVI